MQKAKTSMFIGFFGCSGLELVGFGSPGLKNPYFIGSKG